MSIDPDLIPFEPPAKPLRGLSGLRTFRRNFIETFPRSTYEQDATRVKTRWSDVLYVCDPRLIQEMLVERPDTFGRDAITRRTFAPMIGETSLFLAEGADWRWQRRSVAPIFRHEALHSYVSIFAEMAARQIARWQNAPNGKSVDVAACMTCTTFDIIVETMLGGSAMLDVKRYGRALTQAFDSTQWYFLLAMFSAPTRIPFPGRRRAIKARDYLHREMSRIVAVRREKPTSRTDLLDRLMCARDSQTGRGMTDAELVTNLLTFINAGHDTVAVALTWTLWLIARDATVQRRIFEEVYAVVGEGPIEANHVEGLAFSRQAIQEAMRLYPPIPVLTRQAKVDTSLGVHHVDRCTHIVIPIYAVHRHARLWESPNTFDPDRFAPNHITARSRYIYLPFGAGQRVCIGASFAMIEAVVILAMLVRAFRFRPIPNHKPKPIARVSLRAKGGMPLFLDRR